MDNNKKNWKEKTFTLFQDIKQWIFSWKDLTKNVYNEISHNIQWTNFQTLFEYISQFALVAVISIITLFIMDNLIIYLLKLIFG